MPASAVLVTPEEMFTTRPPSASVPATACIMRNGARASTATSRSKSSTEVCATGPQWVIPALLTRMSSLPNSPIAASATAAGAAGSARSARSMSTRRPSPRTCPATCSASSWPVRYVKPTSAPSAASRRTISAPIPRLPPVTSATFPASRFV